MSSSQQTPSSSSASSITAGRPSQTPAPPTPMSHPPGRYPAQPQTGYYHHHHPHHYPPAPYYQYPPSFPPPGAPSPTPQGRPYADADYELAPPGVVDPALFRPADVPEEWIAMTCTVFVPVGTTPEQVQAAVTAASKEPAEAPVPSKRRKTATEDPATRAAFDKLFHLATSRCHFRFFWVPDSIIPDLIETALGYKPDKTSPEYHECIQLIGSWKKNWYSRFKKGVVDIFGKLSEKDPDNKNLPADELRGYYEKWWNSDNWHIMAMSTTRAVNWGETFKKNRAVEAMYKTLFTYALVYHHTSVHINMKESAEETGVKTRSLLQRPGYNEITSRDLVLFPILTGTRAKTRGRKKLVLDQEVEEFGAGAAAAATATTTAATAVAVTAADVAAAAGEEDDPLYT
ncbi:hypothetical protein ABW21_db0207930 [Orbilia brochopaga]|nr:hypothetical protein ABW21_db0207930 [Drechslerella brochopaga]